MAVRVEKGSLYQTACILFITGNTSIGIFKYNHYLDYLDGIIQPPLTLSMLKKYIFEMFHSEMK